MRLLLLVSILLALMPHAALCSKPVLRVCQGPVCSKNGCANMLKVARGVKELSVQPSTSCLKGCGKGVVVRAEKLGRRILKADDMPTAKAALQPVCKKLGVMP